MNDIALVPVDIIDPHPSNPRRDLGDLIELADSIRAHGIRQNLLLVPSSSDAVTIEAGRVTRYRAVIGHRRLAAARMAGLVEVPAVIDPDLSVSDQVELMLLENIQRADLSPVEEAEGYQQLLDLGVKVTMIAKRTGRARSTINARLRLLALPEGAREKVHTRQVTLEDAAALAEFDDDPDLAAVLVDALGSDDFAWKLKMARAERKEAAARREIIAKLVALGAVEVGVEPASDEYRYVDSFRVGEKLPDAVPEDAVVVDAWSVLLYRPLTDNEKLEVDKSAAARAKQAKQAEEAAAERSRIEAEAETAYELRNDFVHLVLGRKKLSDADRRAIVSAIAPMVIDGEFHSMYDAVRWVDPDSNEYGNAAKALAGVYPDTTPEAVLLTALHVKVGNLLYQWPKLHNADVVLYVLLERLGYQVSDVERAAIAAAAEDPS